MATVLEHKVYSKTDLKKNNNKFWKVWFYSDGQIETQNGRQGAMGQRRFITATGRAAYEAKIREKERKGYIENEVVEGSGTIDTSSNVSVQSANLKTIAQKQIVSTDPTVRALVDYLVKVNAHQITKATGGKITYDTSTAQFKTAVGVISITQVDRAAALLSDLSDMVAEDDYDNYDFEDKLNEYLSLIPRDFGRQRHEPQDILPNLATVQQENALLDGLRASFAGVQTSIDTAKKTTKKTKKKKDLPKVFDVKLQEVTDKKIISEIRKLYQATRKSMHRSNDLSVATVYAVDIATMKAAFETYGKRLKDIRKLWHGTKASNLLSILKQGLIIPPSSSSHCTGRMYGDGLYFSSVSTKALNYATDFWGYGGSTDRTFMFLANVAMGKCYITQSGWENYPVRGYDSTWAKAGRALHNDEMIVYRTDQANLIYLVEFVPRKGYY